jgi:two-component system OmpR family sensor kinase
MFAKSIRARFSLWLAFLLLAVIGGFGFTAHQLYRTGQIKEIDSQLERRLGSLSMDVRGGPGRGGPGGPGGPGFRPMRDRLFPPPEEHEPPPPGFGPEHEFRGPPGMGRGGPPPFREIHLSFRTQALFDESETNGFFYAIWSRTGNLLKQSTNAPATLERPAQIARDPSPQLIQRAGLREVFHYTEMGECVLVGRSTAEYTAASHRFALLLFAAGAGVLFVGLTGGWILTSRALQPIHDISQTASQISGGNLSERINVADTDSELGHLANLLNATFNRLEAAFAQQKQFTGDAAHELRTPLAVIISETQTALARPRTAEEYRETVEACLETAQRMRALTHSLLELARFDAGQEQISRESFDLAEVARACLEDLRPLARENNITVIDDLAPAPTIGDPMRIAQVITNLVTNAVHYNKPNGEVRIATRLEENHGILTIADTGVGIPAESLPHIFERFYRADPSRARGSGHSGLGLAISKAILDAHNATITVQSNPAAGTTFTVRL